MLENVLLPVALGRVDQSALDVAGTIVARNDATLTVLVSFNAVAPIVAGWEYFPAGVYESVSEIAHAELSALANDVRARLAAADCRHRVVVAEALWRTPGEHVLPHARLADLVVLGRGDQADDADRRLFASLLLASGRPLLLVPAGDGVPTRCERVLIAWKPVREAARALHDALPLLAHARAISVVVVDPIAGDEPDPADTEPLRDWFALHGLVADIARVDADRRGTGAAVLAHAGRIGADLLVAGGYGRSRLSEQVFGGVTRTVFESARIPVLVSH